MLDIAKAKDVLEWTPRYDIETAIESTVEWYKRFYNNENMVKFTMEQISSYERILCS